MRIIRETNDFALVAIQLKAKLFGGGFELYEVLHNARGITAKGHVI